LGNGSCACCEIIHFKNSHGPVPENGCRSRNLSCEALGGFWTDIKAQSSRSARTTSHSIHVYDCILRIGTEGFSNNGIGWDNNFGSAICSSLQVVLHHW